MDEPITREEMFLAKAAGEDVNIPAPITRREKYLAKIAENGGGSGGLPAVTASDVGAVMRVQNGTAATFSIIVPEQTVENTGESVELENAVVSSFVAGAKVTATINNKTYSGYIYSTLDGPGIGFHDEQTEEYFQIYLYDGALYFYPESEADAFTVQLNKTDYNAVWGLNSNFDLVIKLEGGLGPDTTGATIVSGSYADAASKIAAGKPVSIYVLGGICILNVELVEAGEISILLLNYAGSGTSVYVASQSGGSATTRVLLPQISTALLSVHPNGTITGWWNN